MIQSQDVHGLTVSCTSSLGRSYTAKKLHKIVTVCKELSDLTANTLVDYTHRGSLLIADPDTDKEGVCSICYGELEYGGDKLLDDGGIHEWTYLSCGATGKEATTRCLTGTTLCMMETQALPLSGQVI